MENGTNTKSMVKLLLNDAEVAMLSKVIPQNHIIQIVKNDPTWGFNSCPKDYSVAYIDNIGNYYTPSMMFQLGGMLRQEIINNK